MKKEIDKHKWTLCNRCEDIKSFPMEDVMCYIFNISLSKHFKTFNRSFILQHLTKHLVISKFWGTTDYSCTVRIQILLETFEYMLTL